MWHLEDGNRWEGFDVDICRAVAAAMFGDADAIEFTIVNGKTRFEFLIDGSIDVLSATNHVYIYEECCKETGIHAHNLLRWSGIYCKENSWSIICKTDGRCKNMF